jgi:hypothetical protein
MHDALLDNHILTGLRPTTIAGKRAIQHTAVIGESARMQ